MTLVSTVTSISYNGNGSTVSFPYPFTLFDDSDMHVYIIDPAGTATQITSGYKVNMVAKAVVYPYPGGAPLQSGYKIELKRILDLTQEIDLVNNNAFLAEVVELGLDRTVAMAQQLSARIETVALTPGPAGPPGEAGKDGVNGTNGLDGVAGATINVGTTTTGAPGSNAAVVNSGTESAVVLDFTIPRGAVGPEGPKGDNAAIAVGTTTTGDAGTNAAVTNSGSSTEAVLNFTIPKGDKGDKGDTGDTGSTGATGATGATGPAGAGAATIEVGSTTTGAAGSNASVSNSGTSTNVVLDFTIPKGDKGDKGDTGPGGATLAIGTTTTSAPGGDAAVTNVGTESAAVFNFTIPRGAVGPAGPAGANGAATVAIGTVTTGNAGTSASVTNVGTSDAAILNITIPKGDTGDTGSTGATGATGATGPAGNTTVAVGTVTTLPAGSDASVTNSGTPSAVVLDFGIPGAAASESTSSKRDGIPKITFGITDVVLSGAVGDGVTNDTAAFTNAFAACTAIASANDPAVLFVPKPSVSYMVDRLSIPSNIKIVFAPGTIINGNPAYSWSTDGIFSIKSKSNVSIQGNGLILKMPAFPAGHSTDWPETVYISASTDIYIENVECDDAWGDGFYLNGVTRGYFVGCSAYRVRRNGMTIVSATDVIVLEFVGNDCVNGLAGTASPGAAISLAPLLATDVLSTIQLRYCSAENDRRGYDLTIDKWYAAGATGKSINVTFDHCTTKNTFDHGYSFGCIYSTSVVGGTIKVLSPYSDSAGQYPIYIGNQSGKSAKVYIENPSYIKSSSVQAAWANSHATSNLQYVYEAAVVSADEIEIVTGVASADVGSGTLLALIQAHIANTSNPHSVSMSELIDVSSVKPSSGQGLFYDPNMKKYTNVLTIPTTYIGNSTIPAHVSSGTPDITVSATGNGTADDTSAFASAFAAATAGTVDKPVIIRVPKPSSYYRITSQLFPPSNSVIIFESGTIIHGGEVTGSGIFKIQNKTNVVMVGEGSGATIRCSANSSDVTGKTSVVNPSGVYMSGTNSNIFFKNIHFANIYYDGIYCGFCNGLYIDSCNMQYIVRNGISIISAKNVVIYGCDIRHCDYAPGPGCIDLEPNYVTEFMDNILISGCYLEDGERGFSLSLNKWYTGKHTDGTYYAENGKTCTITVENCTAKGCQYEGFAFANMANLTYGVTGLAKMVGLIADDCGHYDGAAYTQPYAYTLHNTLLSVPMYVENLQVLNPTPYQITWETAHAGLPWEHIHLYNDVTDINGSLVSMITFSDVQAGVAKLAYNLSQLSDVSLASAADGAMIIRSGVKWILLPKGTNGQTLKMVNGLPAWAT